MNHINIGEFNRWVVWQQGTISTNVFNQQKVYTSQPGCWARVRDLSGRELFNARQIVATVTTEIVIRNPVPFTEVCPIRPMDRFLFETSNRIMNVEFAARMEEGNQYIQILATELAS